VHIDFIGYTYAYYFPSRSEYFALGVTRRLMAAIESVAPVR